MHVKKSDSFGVSRLVCSYLMIYSGFRVEIFMNESEHSGETFYGESVGSISFSYSILVFTIHVFFSLRL